MKGNICSDTVKKTYKTYISSSNHLILPYHLGDKFKCSFNNQDTFVYTVVKDSTYFQYYGANKLVCPDFDSAYEIHRYTLTSPHVQGIEIHVGQDAKGWSEVDLVFESNSVFYFFKKSDFDSGTFNMKMGSNNYTHVKMFKGGGNGLFFNDTLYYDRDFGILDVSNLQFLQRM